VQSLAIREAPQLGRAGGYHPVTPRVFWNLAGRAGRPGYDREGQVLLFEPTLGLDKIKYVLGDYLNTELTANAPVRSALADSIEEIAQEMRNGQLAIQDLVERGTFLLDWQIKTPQRHRKVAAKIAKLVYVGGSARWSRASLPRHIRRRTSSRGSPAGEGFRPVGASQWANHGEALFAVSPIKAGTAGTRFAAGLGSRPNCTYGDEGYARGTWRRRQI